MEKEIQQSMKCQQLHLFLCNVVVVLVLHLIVGELSVHTLIREGNKALIKDSNGSLEGETRSGKTARPLAPHCKQTCLFPLVKPLRNVSVFGKLCSFPCSVVHQSKH